MNSFLLLNNENLPLGFNFDKPKLFKIRKNTKIDTNVPKRTTIRYRKNTKASLSIYFTN